MSSRELILERLEAVRQQLIAHYLGGQSISSASKGREREIFVKEFLKSTLPPHLRFGSGDIVDMYDQKSGQIDIVIEHPFYPSFPLSHEGERLYLAEGVAAALDVKSNSQDQWDQAKESARKLKRLRREIDGVEEDPMPMPTQHFNGESTIPFVVVGYKGPASLETLIRNVDDSEIDAALVIDPPLFYAKHDPYFGWMKDQGTASLMGFIQFLHRASMADHPELATLPATYMMGD